MRSSLVVLALCSCGRIRFDPRSDAAGDAPPDACVFGPWSAPLRLASIASSAEDAGPSLAADGLTLYFHSARVNVGDIFTAVRPDRLSPFAMVTDLANVNGTNRDVDPTTTGDGLEMYFGSDRNGGSSCIYKSQRTSTADPWGAAVSLGVLCPQQATGPFITADGLTLYYALSFNHIVVTTRASRGDAFALGQPIASLPTSLGATAPSLSADGLTIYYDAGGDLYEASRTSLTDAFGTPTPIAVANTTSGEADASISPDGTELYFASNRPGGAGNYDLYVMTRACQ